jgi:hypothetical protein
MRKAIALLALLAALLTGCATSEPNSRPFLGDGGSTPQPQATLQLPEAEDFTLSIRMLEKHCFGSAGCNVTFQVKMDYNGPELDPNVTYLLTYQIHGTEDTYLHTARIMGWQYTSQDHYATTVSSDAELTATVVEISD